MSEKPLTELNAHTARLEFTTGRLLCGQVRDFLEKCKFEGMDITWHEGRGWIERDWIIRGNATDIQIISGSLLQWIKENHLTE